VEGARGFIRSTLVQRYVQGWVRVQMEANCRGGGVVSRIKSPNPVSRPNPAPKPTRPPVFPLTARPALQAASPHPMPTAGIPAIRRTNHWHPSNSPHQPLASQQFAAQGPPPPTTHHPRLLAERRQGKVATKPPRKRATGVHAQTSGELGGGRLAVQWHIHVGNTQAGVVQTVPHLAAKSAHNNGERHCWETATQRTRTCPARSPAANTARRGAGSAPQTRAHHTHDTRAVHNSPQHRAAERSTEAPRAGVRLTTRGEPAGARVVPRCRCRPVSWAGSRSPAAR
jgi:hypothetical protein